MIYEIQFAKRRKIELDLDTNGTDSPKVAAQITLTLEAAEMQLALDLAYEAMNQEYGSQVGSHYELKGVKEI